MESAGLDDILADGRRNALAAWLLVGVAGAAWASGVIVAGPLWSVFALAIVALALLPPIIYRSRYVMLPWEVLAMACLPLLGLAVGARQLSGPLFTYLAVAAVGLVIVVELHSFTSIRMSPGFAVVIVAAATMAAAATWELLQWYRAIVLDLNYDTTNDELMIEFVWATLAGLGAGVLFWTYFRRVVATDRVPETLEEAVAPAEPPENDAAGRDGTEAEDV